MQADIIAAKSARVKRPTFEQARDELVSAAQGLAAPGHLAAVAALADGEQMFPTWAAKTARLPGVPARKYIADSIEAGIKKHGFAGGCFDWFATASPASLKRWIAG